MTTLTCYGGVAEIGGNKFLLETGDLRVFFDFGKSFGRYGDYFDGVFIKERVARGILDPLSLGLIPPLRGLLREDLVPALDPADLMVTVLEPEGRRRKPKSQVALEPQAVDAFWNRWQSQHPHEYRDLRRSHAPPVDGVLLSHAHQDHISDLEYVSAEVPACSSPMTAFISKVLLDTGMPTSGAPYITPRTPKEDGVLEAASDVPRVPRPWIFQGNPPGGALDDDPLSSPASFWAHGGAKGLKPILQDLPPGLRLRHWPVDHSLFGACGFAIETESGWVAYTGDLRFHGERGSESDAFAAGLAALRPIAMLCEGTRLTSPDDRSATESEVLKNCLEAVRQAVGQLVVADFAPRNIERLQTFHWIARETGRRLLVQPKDAYLLRAMHLAEPALPDLMQDASVGLYADPKVRPYAWEEAVRERYAGSTYGPNEVHASPGECLLAFSLTDVVDLLDLQFLCQGAPGGLYLFSNSQAYDDEQKADLVRLWNWTQHLGMRVVGLAPHRRGIRGEVVEVVTQRGYHASGHAGSVELVEFVRHVRPRVLIPIHTEAPEVWSDLLEGTGIEVRQPRYAEAIVL